MLLLSGCAVHNVDEEAGLLEMEVPAQFAESDSTRSMPTVWSHSWWHSFEDEELSQLIEKGLTGNFGIQQFVTRIEQATALSRQAGSRLYPSIDLSAGYDVQRDGELAASETRDRQESSDLGVLLRWEVDIWKRVSSNRRARELETQATIEDWLGARLLLSSAIAETYFEIKEQRRRLEVVLEQIDINERLLKLISLRFGQGQSSIVDVLQQQEQLEETRAQIPDTELRMSQLEYALDLLLGETGRSETSISSSELGKPPTLPELGVPSNLLANRPDLRGAQNRVLALDYDVGAAVADRFPRINIGGAVDWRGDPDFGDEITSLFANLAVPLFDAGDRRSEVLFREARLQGALANYSELFLSAMLDVESALLEERKIAERLALIEQQLRTSQRLLTEARNRFSQGLTDYLPVFTSLNIVQNLEREVVSSKRAVLSARVGLHRALGGPMIVSFPLISFSHVEGI